MRWSLSSVIVVAVAALCRADGPADNNPATVRRLPKAGIEVPADKRAALEARLQLLDVGIERLRGLKNPRVQELLPDVLIFHKAVSWALRYQEFHDPKEFVEAEQQLTLGMERAEQLAAGKSPWTAQTGLVVRGYRSKIDDSVQPYGMVVPADYNPAGTASHRCDIWLHGRGEMMTELNFIRDRRTNPGTFTPDKTLVLHPYGRWNNAFKLAGEEDIWEALAHAKTQYRIDADRIAMRGFSMGGAGAWHMAVHYPDKWFATNPGAGFSETPQFLNDFQGEMLAPLWWEKRLWHFYDCPDWAANLAHCPTIAYSGEKDKQKQAADLMEAAMARENMSLLHVIGWEAGHQYTPRAKEIVEERLAALAARGRQKTWSEIKLTTYTLKYNRLGWLQIELLREHWSQSHVHVKIEPERIVIQTRGVLKFCLDFQAGEWPGKIDGGKIAVMIDGDPLTIRGARSDRSLYATFVRGSDGKAWRSLPHDPLLQPGLSGYGANKVSGRQGPIDDAFTSPFLIVKPTGKSPNALCDKWARSECERAIAVWRQHFRGEPRVKLDSEVTAADEENFNLILFGDPESNLVMRRLTERLPIVWSGDFIDAKMHGKFDAKNHALIAIHPNRGRYIVLNSGFTFRDYAHLNNARQVPVLPDWAIVDLREPPGNVWAGKIVAADFFDEAWELKKTENTDN